MPKRPMYSYLLLVAALGVITAVLGPAGAAGAATDTVWAKSVGSPVTSRGDLTVDLYSTTPVTAVTARVTAGGGPSHVLTVPLVNSGGSAPSGVDILSGWAVAAPISPGQLSLGTYSVSLDVTFQDGSTQSLGNAGTLRFLDEPRITLTADHTGIGYDYSPADNLTGSVQLLAPDGTTTQYRNAAVRLVPNGGVSLPATSVTTDASGGFTVPATVTSNGWIEALVDGAGNVDSQGTVLGFTQVTDPVRLSGVRLAAATVRYGTSAVVAGTLSYLPKDTGTSYQPLPGRRVKVYNSEYPGNVAASGLTDARGQFSVKLPTWNIVGSTWRIAAGNSAGDTLFGQAQVTLRMKVRVPTAITSFHVNLSQYWRLSYSGCLNLPVKIPAAAIPNTANLVFQYSSGGANGPWHNLRWRPPVLRRCGNGGVWFSGTAKAPRNRAYYRVYYHGTTHNGTIHLAVSSAKVLAWKYADRITGFASGPEFRYSRTGKTTLSGRLQYYANSRWHNYGGQVVHLIFQTKASSPWRWIASVRTNSTGYFSATVKAPQTGYTFWSAQFNGNSTHLAAGRPVAIGLYYAG